MPGPIKVFSPAQVGENTCVFVLGGKAYAGGGTYQDFYKYNPVTNTWSQVVDVPITNNTSLGFSLNSKGYVTFSGNNSVGTGMLKYNPLSCYYFQ